MRSKSKKRGYGVPKTPSSQTSSSTPPAVIKGSGRRGRPPSKSPLAPLPHSVAPQPPENHNQSDSPDHSHTSLQDSSDQELLPLQDQASSAMFNSRVLQSLEDESAPHTNSGIPSSYLQSSDGVDKPRKLSKRERKALIKSNKRTRAVVDESFVASMDELSEMFQAKCEVGPFQLHPVPVASDPSRTVITPGSSPRGGRGRGGGRGGRRGHPPKPPQSPKRLFSSWVPLCLPLGGLPDKLKSPSSRLQRLTPRCVRHFLSAVDNILLPPSTTTRLSQPTPSLPSVTAINNKTPDVNGYCNHHHHQAPSLSQMSAVSSAETPLMKSQKPTSSSRRGRGRPPKSASFNPEAPVASSPVEMIQATSPLLDTTANSVDVLTAQPVVDPAAKVAAGGTTKVRRSSTSTPRELRGLVTWDAMMKAAQEPVPVSCMASAVDVRGVSATPLSPLSLQIVPGGVDEGSEQRTTRGRSRRLSTGPASSGSLTTTTSATAATAPSETESCPNFERASSYVQPFHNPPASLSHMDPSKSTPTSTSVGMECHQTSLSIASSPAFAEASGSYVPVHTSMRSAFDTSNEGVIAKIENIDNSYYPVTPSPNRSGSGRGRGGGSGSGRKRKGLVPVLHQASSVLQKSEADLSPPTAPLSPASTPLPPRKRYKVVEDEIPAAAAGFSPSSFPRDGSIVQLPAERSTESTPTALTPNTPAKRPRGRPSKRSGLPVIDDGGSPSSRPKREAAALGFASMVASSLNSSPMHGSPTREDNVLSTVDSVVGAGKAEQTPSPVTPSKRGRKPKKPALLPPQPGEVKIPKPRGRPPKIPRPSPVVLGTSVEAQVTPESAANSRFIEEKKPALIAPDIFIELQPPGTASPEPVVDAQKGARLVDGAHEEKRGEEGKVLNKGKRGRRPTNLTSTSPSAKRKPEEALVEAACVSRLDPMSVERQPMDAISVESCQRLHYESHELRLFLLRTHAKVGRRKFQRRNRGQAAAAGSTTTQELLAAGPIAELPSRSGFFPLSRLSEPIPDPFESSQDDEQTTVRQLYLRLLNIPDVCDSSTRLTAPLLSLPCPLRNPDFYRYICVSGLLGNFEQALGSDFSLQSRILRTVSPQLVDVSSVAQPPFYPSADVEWPPLCLLSVLPHLDVGGFQRLDLLLEFLLRTWEAYAGRRSWLGKQLQQIRALYNQLRTEHATNHPEKEVPLPSAGLMLGSSKGSGPVIAGSGAARKKVDRQTLERGAEVIRCLCGFRVEGGHVMVQCNSCVTRQHLPCIWWALSLDLNPRLAAPATAAGSRWPGVSASRTNRLSSRMARCRAALVSALAAGGHEVSRLVPQGALKGSLASLTDTPYFCPNCLEIDGLTKDYPRTLAVSLAVHNVAAVFRDDVSRHDYWSLGTEDDQFLTDEFAIIHRRDYETSSACLENDRPPLAFASEAIVVRIYRLWKDTDGKSWMEGGAFLRPYDLPSSVLSTTDALWHPRELVYDETSRLVLPLSALRGRCSVLSPSIYRLGRPADLPAVLRSGGGENDHHDPHPLVFLCERLMTKNSAGELLFQDIAPAYLKVTMKPYYFLRHPESSALRAAIVRSSTPSELSALDAVAPLGEIVPSGVESGKLFAPFCKRRWRETEEEPVEESKAEDSSSVWTNEPPSMGQRKTGRSLDAVLARLKPIPLPTNTANTNGTFHHGPRKSQCVKLISSSHGSSTSKSPTKKRSRGLSTSASKPSVTTLTFMQLQQQIALGDDTLTKEAASPVTTPKRRGRKPKPVTFGPLRDDDVDEQIEFEECADVSSPSSPKEAVVADITEEEGVVHTCDSLVVEVLCHVATADDPVSDELLPPPEVLEEPAVQIVSAVDFGGPEECLPVCCDQVVMETPPLATLDVIVHECVGSVSTPVEGNDAATAVAHASSPPAHEIAHARPTPRILHAEFEATPEAVLDIHPVFESVEFLESMPFLVEGVANTMLQAQITSSCVLKEPETCLRQNFEDAYQPISSSSESSSEGSVDVVNDDSRRLKTVWVRTSDGDEQEDSKEQRRSNLSSSRRRKGSSPKKRVFEDPEFVLDLSAKSSGDE